MKVTKTIWTLGALAGVTLSGAALTGCGTNNGNSTDANTSANTSAATTDTAANPETTVAGDTNIKGEIRGDGSSTVFPISEAVAEEFQKEYPNVKVTIGISGTGGGFKKFAVGDTVLQDASRPIEEKEIATAKKNNIEYIELPVAYDGLSVIVNPKNTWAKSLTVAELKKIWSPGSKINNWNQVRAGFPNQPLKLYGAGTDSGTFDYFTKEIVGKEKSSRSDYTASEDDNTLVQGVERDPNALGYFGYAYYEENKDKMNLVAIDEGKGKGAVLPDPKTISSNTYKPLARPLFIYIERKAADKPEVEAFVNFYLDNAKDLVGQVGYVALPDSVYEAAKKRFAARTVGTVYSNPDSEGKPLESLFK